MRERDVRETSERLALSHYGVATNCRSLLQNIVCFIGLFCKRDLSFCERKNPGERLRERET